VILPAAWEDIAREIMNNDPAVKHGVMKAPLFPYGVALMEGKPVPRSSGGTLRLRSGQALEVRALEKTYQRLGDPPLRSGFRHAARTPRKRLKFDLPSPTCYKNWFCVEPARGTIRSRTAGFLAQNIRRGQA
jgi:hypothetical protein